MLQFGNISFKSTGKKKTTTNAILITSARDCWLIKPTSNHRSDSTRKKKDYNLKTVFHFRRLLLSACLWRTSGKRQRTRNPKIQ